MPVLTVPYGAAPAAGLKGALPILFFDLDGTLCDSMDLTIAVFGAVLNKMALPLPTEIKIKQAACASRSGAAKILSIPNEKQIEFNTLIEEMELALLQGLIRPYDKSNAMLEDLSQKSILVLYSDKNIEYASQCIEKLGFPKCFSYMLTRHPFMNLSQQVLSLMRSITPRRGLLAGDTQSEIEAGLENGLHTIGALYGHSSPNELARANQHVKSIIELWDACNDFLKAI